MGGEEEDVNEGVALTRFRDAGADKKLSFNILGEREGATELSGARLA